MEGSEDPEKDPQPGPSHASYKGMKAFLASLDDCLSERVVVIQELEAAMQKLLQKHASFLLKRRQLELRAEAAYLNKLAIRSVDYVPQPGVVILTREARTLLDECTIRRQRRRQEREESGILRHDEGTSTDDEVFPSQTSNFENRRERLLERSQQVFKDVTVEFSDLKKVLLKLKHWREQFPDSYYEAHTSLCLPKVISPFVRIELLDWNPLKGDCVPLERMVWVRYLERFSKSGEVTAATLEKENNPDRLILLASLDMTVFPHLTFFVQSLWDPLSTSQTKSLVERCGEILSLREASGGEGRQSTPYQELLDAAASRLNRSIKEDVFIAVYPKGFVVDRTSIHSLFQDRQFWSAVKLLGNILLWKDLLPDDILRKLALDKLLNRFIVHGLSNTYPVPGEAKKFRKVVESLPENWLSGFLPELCNLTEVLLQAAQQFHDKQLPYEVEEIIPVLGKMNAEAKTRAFLERNNLDLLPLFEQGRAGGRAGDAPDPVPVPEMQA